MNTPQAQSLCRKIEAFFSGGQCFLLAKGRVGLYVGLRALGLPHGSTVLMPGYTCMVVPSAVQFAGLKPAYVDIDPGTYNIDPLQLRTVARDDISAIIVQHTYGIPCDMTETQRWADSRGIPLIEDCCHTFGTQSGGRLCGTFGAFAFLSGQWSKPFSTGLGGMLLVNDRALADRVGQVIDEEAAVPGRLKNLLLGAQILAHRWLVRPRTAGRITELYRALNHWGLVIGSSSNQELSGVMPATYLATMAPCQIRRGLSEMASIDENIRHRKQLAAFYHRELPNMGFAPLAAGRVDEWPLLRYPVRVQNKDEILSRAVAMGLDIGSWFEVPLHPAGTRMEDFGYTAGLCPEAESVSRQVVNLPTHLNVDEATAERTLAFLRKHAIPATCQATASPSAAPFTP
jgi:dTDP-4-amino-4,6-dideoxygalactose transaminase